MNADLSSPVYLSAEAVLEIEELNAGIRTDVPALGALFHVLRTPVPSPTFDGHDSVSMLADIRSYTILRDSLGEQKTRKIRNFPDFSELVNKFLSELETGVAEGNPQRIKEAKQFCLALGENLIGKQMQETYQNRERSDSRYISYDAVL